MVDPISVTSATLTAVKACVSVGWELKQFIDGSKLANTAVNVLVQDVKAFQRTVKQVDKTLRDARIADTINSSGHMGLLWSNLKACLDDATGTIDELSKTITKINNPVKVLDSARKHIRLMGESNKIALFQQQIRSYKDTIYVSLQTAVLSNQVESRAFTAKVVPTLHDLQATIRRLAQDTNTKIELTRRRLSSAVAESEYGEETSGDDERRLREMQNLRKCLQSAASIVTSASTVPGLAGSVRSSAAYHSDFGDVFPPIPSDFTLNWIAASQGNEVSEPHSWKQLSGTEARSSINHEVNEVDSNDELDLVLVEEWMELGKLKLSEKRFEEAENYFNSCITTASMRDSSSITMTTAKLNAMSKLITTFQEQCKWNEAEKLLRQRIETGSRSHNAEYRDLNLDTLMLAEVLLSSGNVTEADLYARKAYLAYKKMGYTSTLECERSLNLLVKICRTSGRTPHADAYMALLRKLRLHENENSPKPVVSEPGQSEMQRPQEVENGEDLHPHGSETLGAGDASSLHDDYNSERMNPTVSQRQDTMASFRGGNVTHKKITAIEGQPRAAQSASEVQVEDDPTYSGDSREISHGSSLEMPPAQMSPAGFQSTEPSVASNSAPDVTKEEPNPKSTALRQHNKGTYLSLMHVRSLALSPDGKLLASGSADGTVRLWDATNGAALHLQSLKGHTGAVCAVAFTADGKRLVSGSGDRTVRLWDASTGAAVKTLKGHTKLIWAVAFSPDGKRLASGSADYTARLWDAATGIVLQKLEGNFRVLAFSPDGKRLALGSSLFKVMIWDAARGAVRQVGGYVGPTMALAFSPDGELLASAARENTVKIWNGTARTALQTLGVHAMAVTAVAFSPDGKMLASGSGDGTATLWKWATRERPRTLRGHTGPVRALAFSLDGRSLTSASEDWTVWHWDVATGKPRATYHLQ